MGALRKLAVVRRLLGVTTIATFVTVDAMGDVRLGPLVLAQVAVLLLHLALELHYQEVLRNESRRAARDRERAGTGAALSAYASGYTSGYTSGPYSLPFAAWPTEPATENPGVKEREGDLPYLAFKVATLEWALGKDFGPRLASQFGGFDWNSDDPTVAYCANGGDHKVPELTCTCGFYARRRVEEVQTGNWGCTVLLDVELFGKVIVYEHGYRAERQRILRVGLSGCWYCGIAPAVIGCQLPGPFDGRSESAIVSFCAEHASISGANASMTCDELSERLCAPVGWAEQLEPMSTRGVYGS